MNKYVDLHIHTCASDGTWNPEEVVRNVKSSGIEIFAVTDHNEITNVEATQKIASQSGLRCISGVELSATYRDREYHILAYKFDLQNPVILERVNKNSLISKQHDLKVIESLMSDYKEISCDEFLEYKGESRRGGWPSLNYLIDKGIIQDMYQYFDIEERLDLKMVFDTPEEIIRSIREAGAIAILAHPPAYTVDGFMEMEQLEAFVSFGIQGLECYSPYYKNQNDSKYYVEFCKRNGLYISGGSDCHGSFVPSRKLKHPEILKEQLVLPFL